MKKKLQLWLLAALVLSVIWSMSAVSFAAPDQPKNTQKVKRTILLYDCGTDLETDAAMATYNLRQILKSNFSANDDVKFIIMTGGTDKWHLEKENLVFPDNVDVPSDAVAIKDPNDVVPSGYSDDPKSEISNVYNQIWEAKGANAEENPGKMVLVDGDGVLGDGPDAKRNMIKAEDFDSEKGFDYSKADNYEWMNKPEVLKAFINYGVEHYPADKYDLILWDHGGGPTGGFCSNQQEPAHGFFSTMTIAEMADVFADNKVVDADSDGVQDGKFDFIDFDACLMSGVETTLAFSDYMDYYIASPETEPGYGQYYGPSEGQYTGWLDALGSNPDIDTYDLGKIIVDDFIKFYDKESGDGSSQEGTLAVIDIEKLITTNIEGLTFVEALSQLDEALFTDLRGESYFDEFRSFKNSIAYADDSYHDLGNLLSQLAYEFDDIDYYDWKDGNINYISSYTVLAKVLMGIIGDENVMYARSTKGIHTGKHFYMDKNGDMQYGEQPTSGLYIWFDPKEDPDDRFLTHHMFMTDLIDQMKQKDPNDARAAFFENHLRTAEKYGIAYFTGLAVSDMVSGGMDPQQIDYDAVWDYWNTHYYNNSIYDPLNAKLNHYFDHAGGEPLVKGWLQGLINQMRIEAVQKDKVQAQSVKTDAGNGYSITLNEIRKPAVDNIKMNVIAELPALKDFLNDPAHASYVNSFKNKSPGVTIGTIDAKEVIDIDPEIDGMEKTLDWLFDPTSTWTLDPPQTKWYALRDAGGDLHVTAAEFDENEIDIPAGYATMEPQMTFDEYYNPTGYSMQEVWHKVWLIFMKDENGNWPLYGLAFAQENGGYRLIETEDYQGEYELWPVMEFGTWDELVPISYKPFMLTADTVDKLKPEFMDLSEIGNDVADIDGDGKAAHNTVTVTNIFGYQTDISDIVKAADVIDISNYKVTLAKTSYPYTGKAIKPSVKVAGLTSKDYTVSYKNNTKVGTATVIITAKGDQYKGTIKKTFKIVKAANTLSVKGKTASVKYSKLKNKTQKLAVTKVIKFKKKGQGAKTFKLVSAKKGSKSFKKYFKINKKSGKVTIKKGLKKGTYKVKVKIKAKGNANYKASAWKKVTFKVKVK